MKKFRQKEFASVGKSLNYLKEHPTVPLGVATLGVSTANLAINKTRQVEAKDLSNKQLDVLNKQINIISDNTKALRENSNLQKKAISLEEQKKATPAKKKKRFKLFSIKSSTLQGATLGLSIGTFATPFLPKSFKVAKNEKNTISKKFRKGYNGLGKFQKQTVAAGAGLIIGAALGAIVGTVLEISDKLSRNSVGKDRMMKDILSNLKKDNFKEGTNFTRDPKIADRLKMRVCVAVNRSNGDLRVLINTKSDPKLKNLTDNIVKNIPNAGVRNTSATNKYNEITITTISDSSADATLVSGIISQFIHSGYPVYMVEVG